MEAFAPPGGRAEALPIPRPRAREAAAQAVRALRVKGAFEEAAEKGARMVVLSHFSGAADGPVAGRPVGSGPAPPRSLSKKAAEVG